MIVPVKKMKLYNGFLTFSFNTRLKDLNLLAEYYKRNLKIWGSTKTTAKIYFFESKKFITSIEEKTGVFCLKMIFTLDPKNINLFLNLIKLNLKIKKALLLSIKSYGSTKKTSIKSKE